MTTLHIPLISYYSPCIFTLVLPNIFFFIIIYLFIYLFYLFIYLFIFYFFFVLEADNFNMILMFSKIVFFNIYIHPSCFSLEITHFFL